MGDKRGAADQIERAMKLEPRNPLVLSMAASIAAAKGRMDEAVALQRRSVEADPLTIVSRVNLIAWLTMAERFQEARAELIRVRELNPNHSEGRLNLAELNLLEGRFAEALEMANRMPTGPQRLFVQALALYGLGDEAGSGEAVQALIRSAGEEHPFRVAEALAFCGKPDEAFQWLHGSANRFEDDPLIEYSPFLRTLRLDPRWPVWIRSAERKRDDAAGSRASG
jgi:tetratricopeptide (TPR) repeat protein